MVRRKMSLSFKGRKVMSWLREEDIRLCQNADCKRQDTATRVCHHPQCTEDNNNLPLLLCRQCDLDIHRQPEYTGHLVLDTTSKRSSGNYSPQRQSRSPADSDSETSHHDDESLDGKQLFVKKPSKDFKRNRSPSEVERKLKRKKAVKKRSFSKNDSQKSKSQSTLEAALEQIAHPEGPDLMANLAAHTDGDDDGSLPDGAEGSDLLARKNSSASVDFSSASPSMLSAVIERGESQESSSLDPGLPPPSPGPQTARVPVRRQSRVTILDNNFTVKLCIPDVPGGEDLVVLAAVSSTTLRDALEPILEKRAIDINEVNVFIEKSHTPLPLSSDVSFLAGNVLEIKEKDDNSSEMVSQGAGGKQQRPSSASKASSTSSSSSVASSSAKASKSSGGSLRGRRGTNLSIDDTYSVPSTSPQGTLTFSEGKKVSRTQKLSVASLFQNNTSSSSTKEREKLDQLNEILSGYSNNGLPPLPELLSLGRRTFDDTVFQLEDHWSILVDNSSSLTKQQHDQQEAIWELLNTELSYIGQVRVIIDVFKSCLLNVQQDGLLNEIELERLFSNIDQILDSNCQLWQFSLIKVLEDARINRHPLNPSLMKTTFNRDFQNLKEPYARYCMEQKQCVEYMKSRHNDNELFKIFVQWAEAQKQCNRLKLTDLLVKPMQRLTKYSLLLQAILRKTEDERQRKDLLEMISKVDQCVNTVNSQMKQQHDLERLEAIMTKLEAYDAVEAPNDECVKILQEYNNNFNLMAPMSGFSVALTRALLMHSSLRMKEAQTKPADVDCFLFTDLILVCKANKRMDKIKIIRPPMRLDQLVVCELKDKGSFLLIYMNEYHIPIAAYTFHGDQSAVRSWLEKIRDAQSEYSRVRLEDRRKNDIAASSVAEEVVYTPLPGEGPLTMDRPSLANFPRSDSVESTEGRFLPNSLTAYRGLTVEPSSPEKSPTGNYENPLGSYNEVPPPSMGVAHVAQQSRLSSLSSPDFSPGRDRKHREVKACYSVPNMEKLRVVDPDGEDVSGNTLSVNAAIGSPSSSLSNLAEPGPVEGEDESSRLNKSSQRRVSRNEKRYYTADSIQELQNKEKDTSIHKRLSWQNEPHMEERLRKKVLSTDSVHSIPSSSGVSSNTSLHLNPESDITEETEMQRSGSSRTLQGDGSPVGSGGELGSQGSKAKSTPDIVSLFSTLRTGEPEAGISSVDMPGLKAAGNNKKMTQAQLLQLKRILLNESDVEASEV